MIPILHLFHCILNESGWIFEFVLSWLLIFGLGQSLTRVQGRDGVRGRGSKCIMRPSESEHVLISGRVLLEITFLSFPCQHKYLSEPVSGAPLPPSHRPLSALAQDREIRCGGGRKIKASWLLSVCTALHSAALTRTAHMQTDAVCASSTSRGCPCDAGALQASCCDSFLHALRDLIWGCALTGRLLGIALMRGKDRPRSFRCCRRLPLLPLLPLLLMLYRLCVLCRFLPP